MKAIYVVAAALLVAACSADQGAQDNAQVQTKATEREARVGPVGFAYDQAQLTIMPIQVDLPPDNERQVRGMKLVATPRVAVINAATCPNQTDAVCQADMARREGGVTLTVLNAPFADFSAPITNTRPVTIAGREGVTWDGEFAETPATFSLVPVEHQTLMVIRQNGGEGAPDAATLDGVLNALTVGQQASQQRQ